MYSRYRRGSRAIFYISAIVLLLLILVAVISSCAPAPVENNPNQSQPEDISQGIGYRVERYVDREAGTVCWIAKTSNSDGGIGIDCIPMNELPMGSSVR